MIHGVGKFRSQKVKMGSRYWITGVQLGMLIAFAKVGDEAKAWDLANEIIDKQYLIKNNENKTKRS